MSIETGVVASEPIRVDLHKKHYDRLRVLNMIGQVVNELKPRACTGILNLSADGTLAPWQERYLYACRRHVPELGVTVTLTRDYSSELDVNLRLGYAVHLSLEPIDAKALAEFAKQRDTFQQVCELDDTSAADWYVTAMAPHQDHCWRERLPSGLQSFRLFCDVDFNGPKKVWSNQARGLLQTLGWTPMRGLA